MAQCMGDTSHREDVDPTLKRHGCECSLLESLAGDVDPDLAWPPDARPMSQTPRLLPSLNAAPMSL